MDRLPQGMKGHSSCARSPRRSTVHRYIQNNDGSIIFKFRISGNPKLTGRKQESPKNTRQKTKKNYRNKLCLRIV